VEEASFKTTGNNADVAFGGVYQQMIMNPVGTLHGSVRPIMRMQAEQQRLRRPCRTGFQSHQSDDSLLRLQRGLRWLHLKNKLWFYGGASKQEIDQLQIGYVKGPNPAGC
jgi:hypothetical protein